MWICEGEGEREKNKTKRGGKLSIDLYWRGGSFVVVCVWTWANNIHLSNSGASSDETVAPIRVAQVKFPF
jgi:hypothetical protein